MIEYNPEKADFFSYLSHFFFSPLKYPFSNFCSALLQAIFPAKPEHPETSGDPIFIRARAAAMAPVRRRDIKRWRTSMPSD